MNIKSLLLGSAAALVAVSGARAADAVVIAEPEPMEYVRICDTYGAGFYYIPGTETCLKFSGYIRYDIGVGSLGLEDVFDKETVVVGPDDDIDPVDGGFERNDTYYKRARFQLRVDARQETELGTLRGYAAVNFQYDTYANAPQLEDDGWESYPWVANGITTTADSLSIDHAYIELGGFRVGKTDSLYNTFVGFAGPVINDEVGGVGYGAGGTHQIAYTFTGGNGFSAAIALEEGSGAVYTLDSYTPHVTGGLGYAAGWGSITGVAGYDGNYGTFAGKLRGDFKIGDAVSLFVMGGWADDADEPNYYKGWGGDWAIWGGGSWRFSEKAAFNLQVAYDDSENFGVAANVDYTLVNGFVITPEVTYSDNFDTDVDGNEWGGMLRFQYNWGS